MKLLNLLLADAASAGPGNKFFIHGGGVSFLESKDFPYQHPRLGLLLTIVRENEPPGTDHEVALSLLGPTGSALETLIETNVRIPDDVDPDSPVHINLLAEFNGLRFPEAGLYWFCATVDDVEMGRAPLRIGGKPPRVSRPEDG